MNARILLLSLALAVSARADSITDYFDAALAGNAPYAIPGISGRDLRAYEIVNRTKGVIAVRLTFPIKGGGDQSVTKKFKLLGNGRLAALDADDIHAELMTNLKRIAAAASQAKKAAVAEPITVPMLVERKLLSIETLTPLEGVDYAAVKIAFESGETVSIRVNEEQKFGFLF